MPTASQRDKAKKSFGGSAVSTNEEKTTHAASPVQREPVPARPGPQDDKAGKPGDHTRATGRDHPSQTEHTHRQNQRLHGESDKRLKENDENGPGAETKVD